MADSAISQLPAAVALTGAEVLWVVILTPDSVDFVEDFSGVGDGLTDNSEALNDLGDWARIQSSVGAPVVLAVSDGIYNFVGPTSFTALLGILDLRIVGSGAAVFQNTVDTSPWIPSAPTNFNVGDGGVADLIESCSEGAAQVTLLTVENAALYEVGSTVAIMSEDIQISSNSFSFPPNCNLFDFVTVLSNNPGTGVVTFTPALSNSHSADNIDGPIANPFLCGKARIWKLNGALQGIDFDWGAEHVYEGLTIPIATGSPTTYITMMGRYQKWTDCILCGISPQTAEYIEISGGQLTDASEPDKLCKTLLIDGVDIDNIMLFQSSSINVVVIQNSNFDLYLASGAAKHITLTNNTIATYTEGVASSYGHNLSTTINGGTVGDWPFLGEYAGSPLLFINGEPDSVTYADGVIKVAKARGDLREWNVVPNVTCINLCTGAGENRYFTGDLGSRMVLSLTEDADFIYYHVETWGASLPAYANGWFRPSKQGPIYVNGVTGCQEIETASDATALGKFYWNLLKGTLTGTPSSGNWAYNQGLGHAGNLTRAVFNVTVASGALLTLSTASVVAAADMTGSVPFEIVIDTTVTGVRTFTQSALTGKVGNDDVLLNAVSQSTLPVGKWVQTPFFYTISGSPNVTLELEFDSGVKFRSAGAV